jgi:hypothetical protein
MRSKSKKTTARERDCAQIRRDLIEKVGRCELPGHVDKWFHGQLLVHEIARGPARLKALDKRYATLVVCYACHQRIHDGQETWGRARELAALKASRPKDVDLDAFNELQGTGARRITPEDMEEWNGR